MAMSLVTPSSFLLVPFHKRSLIRTSSIPRTLVSLTTEIPEYSLISSIPPANFPLRTIRCVSGEDSSDEIAESPSPSTSVSSIFVKGLAQSVSEGRLRKAFSEFGEVTNVKIIIKNRTRQSLGYGYVWFAREEHAQIAAEAMNGKFFEGRFILVKLGQPGLSSGRRSNCRRSDSDSLFVKP
ncbi:PREDICTED: uncharacterized RNA-binding protein C25G10.01 [Tarenaya hassleriana]|uniref:uncharacterized RNA-binding protein C25G10.01 n=1 Tax=Tarenaya hassleriana TaxID=28532 RepID=UPI00053C83F6|nr:PREDICTED: uncharacterized RNA-binding protein C25G10.01 [Tarenaya hassleriana]